MAADTIETRAILEIRFFKKSLKKGIPPQTKAFGDRLKRPLRPDPRGIPSMVVEAEITDSGSTELTVYENKQDVISVYRKGVKYEL